MRHTLSLFLTFLLVTACGPTGSAIRTGDTQHPPTPEETVDVYFEPENVEQKYTDIGRVTAENTSGWTFSEVDPDKIIAQLKEEAASIGAHAIVIESTTDGQRPWAVQGAGGTSSLDTKSAEAVAIRYTER